MGINMVPKAWVGPNEQVMPHQIYVAWARACPDSAQHFHPLYDADQVVQAQMAERELWHLPAFLWSADMPEDVMRWVSAHMPKIVPRCQMQRVKLPNAIELIGDA